MRRSLRNLAGALLPALLLGPALAQQTVAPAPATILYDTIVDESVLGEAVALGARPVLMIYQVCDPACSKTGVIDTGKVIEEILRRTEGRLPEWGMLDFEEPFMEWLESGPDTDRWRIASRSMVETMERVRLRFPETKWTYYQIPYIRYWVGGSTWDAATNEARKEALDRCFRTYEPVARSCDWISPSLYCFYDPDAAKSGMRDEVRRAGRAWRAAGVRLSKLMCPGRPVIPIVSPVWQINGDAPVGAPVPADQMIEDVIDPCRDAGAQGLVVWTAYRFYISSAIEGKATDQRAFDRTVIARTLLDDRVPEDWSAPEVQARAFRSAAQVVLRTIRDIRRRFNPGPPESVTPSPAGDRAAPSNPPVPQQLPAPPRPAAAAPSPAPA